MPHTAHFLRKQGCPLRTTAPATVTVPHRRAQPRRASTRCFSNSENGVVGIRFQLPYHCKYGQRLCLIGSSGNLGAWDVAKAVPMEWSEGDVWTVELQLPPSGGAQLEYKYVVRHERDMSAVRWKEGGNLYLQLPVQGRLHVRDTWDESMREVEFVNKQQQASDVQPTTQHAQLAQHPVPQPAASQPAAAEQVGSAAAAAAASSSAPVTPAPSSGPGAPGHETSHTTLPAAAPVRRPRKKKVDEDEEAAAAISKAANKAMQQLDGAVTRSLDLLAASSDPATPEILAADRQVAAAARRAATMNRALDAAKEAKLLPPTGTKPRRRRKDSSQA